MARSYLRRLFRRSRVAQQPRRRSNFQPSLEILEDRNLLAVLVGLGGNVNVSKLNDNQAEATIAINPTNPQAVFTASVTWHGNLEGKFDPFVNVANVFKDHTPGLFVAYGNNTGGGWSNRLMLTGGPTEANQVERSLPSAFADPQAAFDDYGNLYLTYLSGVHQFGTATSGGGNTLTDTTRQWVPNMWAGRVLTIRPGVTPEPGVPGEESAIILSNTADTLTISQSWNDAPGNGTVYEIRSGAFAPGQPFQLGNAAVVLLSTNDGQSFQFLKFLDSGALTPTTTSIDYPAVATGPGSNANEKSVWFAWRGSNNKIMATGAPVTARGAIGTFIANEEVIGSTARALPRVAVGPNGQVMVSFIGIAGAGDTTVPIYTNVDDDGLGNNGFRATAKHVADTTVLLNPNPPLTIIDAQPNRGITPQVNLAWDRSGNYVAAPHGRVYLTYTYSFGGGDTDIAWTTSDNSGTDWSPWQVLFPNANSQFLPSPAVDQTNGDVAVVWLDARDDPANVRVKLYGTVSGDGGATWEGLAGPYPIAQGQSDATRTNLPQRGNSTGGNTNSTLNDTNQNWTPNNYWRTNFGASVPDVLLPFTITESTATRLTVNPAWADAPGEGASYTIDPLYKFDYGEYTGVAFLNGVFYAVWPDNSNSTTDNPNGTRGWLDLYTVRGTVTHVTGQWANGVVNVSSEFNQSPGDWSAAKALGPPDVFAYGDNPKAWSAASQNGSQEFITLGFENPVYAQGVTIRQTYGNGFVTGVDLLDVNDNLYPIWTGTDPTQPGSPGELTITFPPVNALIKGVKIYVNTDHNANAWEQIDAVMLFGEATEGGGGGLAPLTGGPGLAAALTGVRVSGVRRPNVGPFATFSASGPVLVGRPVTFTFSSPSGGSGFRYSFDFNNDGDFTDPGERADGTASSAAYTFTTRGWRVVRGRVRAADGTFTDFWLRVFVL